MPDSLGTKDTVFILKDSLQTEGLFDNHLLKKVSPSAEPFIFQREYWVAIILVFCLAILVYLKTTNGKRLRQIFQAFLQSSAVGQLLREEYALTNRVSVMLMSTYFLIFPLFLTKVFLYYGLTMNQETAFGLYLVLLSIVFVLFILRVFFLNVLGVIFEKSDTASSYIFTMLLFSKNLALILFPVVLAMSYAKNLKIEWILWTGFILFAIVLLYRILRTSALILHGRGISILYLFLYLCTLEILPFIVLIKVFRMNFL